MRKAVIVEIRRASDGAVLTLTRGDDHEHFPGQPCLPGGKLDHYLEKIKVKYHMFADAFYEDEIRMQEGYEEAAFREVQEETGIQLTSINDYGEWLSDGKFIVKVFHAMVDDTVEPTREFPNREHKGYQWTTANTIDPLTGKMTMHILNQAFNITEFAFK